ncbi:MAG: type III pantothenate kinase [Chitinophagales bacterium]|nr:type III pantothenate kinase [Chitinophagales bacterium]
MNLAIDIGNTRVKVGVFDDARLEFYFVFDNISLEKINDLATNHKIENIIYSSVNNSFNTEEIAKLSSNIVFLELTSDTPLPIKNLYRTPKTLGKDRLAAVIGAWANFPGKDCLIVDVGTCITYDILQADGAYLGGNIAPGINMRLKAMHAFTARLPELETRTISRQWIGDSTDTAMQNGAQVGALMEATAFIDYCEQRFGTLEVIFTGGDADFFANHLKRKIFVNQNLVLEGLNKILEYNVE